MADKLECVLKCQDAIHFFDLPSEDILRNLWRYKLGIENSDEQFKVCNKHFSENMLNAPYTELLELAVPDQNLPEKVSQKKSIYEKLIEKISGTSTEKESSVSTPPQAAEVPAEEILTGSEPTTASMLELTTISSTTDEPTIASLMTTEVMPTSITTATITTASVANVDLPMISISNVDLPTISTTNVDLTTTATATAADTTTSLTNPPVTTPSTTTAAPTTTSLTTIDLTNTANATAAPTMTSIGTVILNTTSTSASSTSKSTKSRTKGAKSTTATAKTPAAATETPSAPRSTIDWLNDSSNLLMDYQLRVKGQHMCDVIEIPQYVVVFTVFKAKEPPQAAIDDFVASRSKENKKTLTIPPSITVSKAGPKRKRLPPPANDVEIIERSQMPNGEMRRHRMHTMPHVDYIYFSTNGSNPMRERSVQVDINSNSRETAVQCDVQLDQDVGQMIESASQLQQIPEDFDDGNKYECLVCGEILDTYLSRVKHSKQHVKVRSLCALCGLVFSNRSKLKAHEMNVHYEPELKIRKALRCPKLHCKKAFHSKRQLINHIEDHISSTVHKCSKCLRLFPSSLKLHCHQRTFKNCVRRRDIRNAMYQKKFG